MSNKAWDLISYNQSYYLNMSEAEKEYDKLLKAKGYREHDPIYQEMMALHKATEELKKMRECCSGKGVRCEVDCDAGECEHNKS